MYIYYTDGYEGGQVRSRELLTAALRDYIGNTDPQRQDAQTPDIMLQECGKPYIEGGPEFSVSHSGTYWAVLIGEKQCGLDIQIPRDKARIVSIARKLYSDREAELVELLGEDIFYKIWTRREALVKCYGGSVFNSELPELLMPPGKDFLNIYYRGANRVIFDLELPVDLYVSICITVDEEWQTIREVPKMKRLDI